MTNDPKQNHDHKHGHNHSHDHTHSNRDGHSHKHEHSPADQMTLEQKLEKLLTHWIDHNDSHKDTFFTWAQRAKDEGINKIADKIEKAGKLSEQVTILLKEAFKELNK